MAPAELMEVLRLEPHNRAGTSLAELIAWTMSSQTDPDPGTLPHICQTNSAQQAYYP